MDAESLFMILTIIAMLPLFGVILALTPYLVKKGEVFAVTVPESASNDEQLKRFKRQYTFVILGATLILTVLTLLLLFLVDPTTSLICMIVSACFIAPFSYALMLHYRKKVNHHKTQKGWSAEYRESVTIIGESAIPQAISLKWNLLYLPIFAITALIGILGYDQIPNQVPMQMNLSGELTTWTDKSPWIVAFPVIIEAFFAACFLLAHWAITRSKKPADPSAPVSSAVAYGLFARAQSFYLVIGGLLMTAVIILMPLTFMGIFSFMQAALFIVIVAIVLVLGAVAVSIVYGQGGARVFRHMQSSNTLLADDDHYWKLGIFYFNREDPNLFLPARFGIGWTCNFARPLVWVLTFSGIVLTVIFIVAIFAIV